MKKKTILFIFIAGHLVFVFLKIHEQSRVVGLNYENQRLTKQKNELIAYKNGLEQKLCALRDLTAVKLFAQKKLGMQRIRIDQLKQLAADSAIVAEVSDIQQLKRATTAGHKDDEQKL